MAKKFAIIGTGVTGTAVLIELTRQLQDIAQKKSLPSGISIITVEKYPMNGPGYPYNYEDTLPAHLINHRALEMAIKAADAQGIAIKAEFDAEKWRSLDFLNWLKEKRSWILKNHPELITASTLQKDVSHWQPHEDDHYPRALFGYYMEDRFNEASQILKKLGVTIVHYNQAKATSIDHGPPSLVLTIREKGGKKTHIPVDKLLLATGRWPSQPFRGLYSSRYFDSPFPAAKILRVIKPGQPTPRSKRVIIEGTGLSGVDAALSLATGTFTRNAEGKLVYDPGPNHAHITMVSRRGYFPVVRSYPKQPPALVHFTAAAIDAIRRKNNGYISLDQFKDLLRKEIHEHLPKKPLSYYFLPDLTPKQKLRQDFAKAHLETNVLYAICRQIDVLGPAAYLAPKDRESFLARYKSIYLQNVSPLPVINAEKILALFDANILDAVPLGHEGRRLQVYPRSVCLMYGEKKIICGDYIINATGDEADIEKNSDPLIQSMLTTGSLIPNKLNYATNYQTRTAHKDGIKASANYAVLTKNGNQEVQSQSIYAIGMLVSGWHPEKNFASASVEAASTLVAEWIASLDSAESNST